MDTHTHTPRSPGPYTVPLRELKAKLTTAKWGQADDAPSSPALLCLCPLCGEHSILIAYTHGQPQHSVRPGIGNVWGHVGGSTVDDLTLAPSYLALGRCRLHVFVRDGQLEVLSDSRGPL